MSLQPGPATYPPPDLLERSLDLLFPPLCVGCRRVGRWLCARCWQHVSWHPAGECIQCGAPSTASICCSCSGATSIVRGVLAVAEFDGLARESIHTLKYHGRHAIAGMMGRLMARQAASVGADVVVPVPLHKSRRRERGYDQSVMLARSVAKALDIPTGVGTLTRVRATKQQALLDGLARRTNVEGAFLASQHLHGEAILLVDDVTTTGATLDAAASALRDAGAGPVTGLVFAIAS